MVASHDDKAVSCARLDPGSGLSHDYRSWSSLRTHRHYHRAALCAREMAMSPMFVAVLAKGAPREARCKDHCQRCRGHRRLCYLAQALGDITNAHRPLCGVQSSSHALLSCLPQVSRVPSQPNRQPGRKSADALSPKRTGRVNATLVGTTFLDPRRPPSLGHLVI